MKIMVYVMTTIITIGVPTTIGIVYNDHVNQIVMAEDVKNDKADTKKNTDAVNKIVTCMKVVEEQIKQINGNIKDIKDDLKELKNKSSKRQR